MKKSKDYVGYESILERITYSKGYTIAYELVLIMKILLYMKLKSVKRKIIYKNSRR